MSAVRRELARLELELAIDRVRVQRSKAALRASVRRTVSHPVTLITAFTLGAIGTSVLGGRRRSERAPASGAPGTRRGPSARSPRRTVWRLLRPVLRPMLQLWWSQRSPTGKLLAAVAGPPGPDRHAG